MLVLKKSTSIDIRMGPFSDATDGVTPETDVLIASASAAVVLKANGAAKVDMGGTFAAVTSVPGWYDYTVAAGDVDTVGEVEFVMVQGDKYLPVFKQAQVVTSAVYDALFGSAAAAFDANQRVDVGSWLGNAVTASSGNPDVNVETIDDNVITSAKLAANAIGASQLATDAVNEIWTCVVETNSSVTAQQAMSGILASTMGVTGTGGTVFYDPTGTTIRFTATVNGSNERTAIAPVYSSAP